MSDISLELRRVVAERAGYRCEYCHLPQSVVLHKHEPDHIVPVQHGGKTEAANLALACIRCNRFKGPNVGSFDPQTGELVRFFNPRTDGWESHFQFDLSGEISPLTPEGRVTVLIFLFFYDDRVVERRLLYDVGLFS